MLPTRPPRRAASAMDEPMSPVPTIATRSKTCGSSATSLPLRHEALQRVDHEAVRLLGADGQPQVIGQAVGRDGPQDETVAG